MIFYNITSRLIVSEMVRGTFEIKNMIHIILRRDSLYAVSWAAGE